MGARREPVNTRSLFKKQEYYFESQAPTQEDNPPTLMRNPSWLSAGEDLVTFYMTPGYQTWDPSAITFVSFAIFFAKVFSFLQLAFFFKNIHLHIFY